MHRLQQKWHSIGRAFLALRKGLLGQVRQEPLGSTRSRVAFVLIPVWLRPLKVPNISGTYQRGDCSCDLLCGHQNTTEHPLQAAHL